jgi:hypothetical protein
MVSWYFPLPNELVIDIFFCQVRITCLHQCLRLKYQGDVKNIITIPLNDMLWFGRSAGVG